MGPNYGLSVDAGAMTAFGISRVTPVAGVWSERLVLGLWMELGVTEGICILSLSL